MTEIKYGRIQRDGKIVGYATFIDGDNKVEIFAPPYKRLECYVNGQRVPCNAQFVMIWTKVAGWLAEIEKVTVKNEA